MPSSGMIRGGFSRGLPRVDPQLWPDGGSDDPDILGSPTLATLRGISGDHRVDDDVTTRPSIRRASRLTAIARGTTADDPNKVSQRVGGDPAEGSGKTAAAFG